MAEVVRRNHEKGPCGMDFFLKSEREITLPSLKPVFVLKWNVESTFLGLSVSTVSPFRSSRHGLVSPGMPQQPDRNTVGGESRPVAENGALLKLRSQCRSVVQIFP